ncbi:MAG: hypothetical protein ACYC6L_12690 [Anaerolineae bacterium]
MMASDREFGNVTARVRQFYNDMNARILSDTPGDADVCLAQWLLLVGEVTTVMGKEPPVVKPQRDLVNRAQQMAQQLAVLAGQVLAWLDYQ